LKIIGGILMNSNEFELKYEGKYPHIFLNGKEIQGVHGFSFSESVSECPMLHLDLIVNCTGFESPEIVHKNNENNLED
jgi:hypothetical protein